jgi:hypothetical protein
MSEETRRKISESGKGRTPWNKDKKGVQTHSDKTKNKMSESSARKVQSTQEMLDDIKFGMSRRKFGTKYGTQGIWNRMHHLI